MIEPEDLTYDQLEALEQYEVIEFDKEGLLEIIKQRNTGKFFKVKQYHGDLEEVKKKEITSVVWEKV